MIPKTVTHISLDVGFTLIYPKKAVGQVYADIAAQFGYPVDGERVNKALVQKWQEEEIKVNPIRGREHPQADDNKSYLWWRDIFFSSLPVLVNKNDQKKMFDYCYNLYAHGKMYCIYPEVIKVLTKLQQKYTLVILSNWDYRLNQTLLDLNLTRFFNNIFISSEIGFAKPDPGAFSQVLSNLEIEAHQLLHIGDSYHQDYLGASQQKIPSLVLNRKDWNPNSQKKKSTDQISSLSNLL